MILTIQEAPTFTKVTHAFYQLKSRYPELQPAVEAADSFTFHIDPDQDIDSLVKWMTYCGWEVACTKASAAV